MTDVNEVVETTETVNTEVAAPVKEAKPDRIVTMKDGSVVNFGVRGNVISHADAETGILNFKTIEGDEVTFDTNGIEVEGSNVASLSPFIKQVFLFGILAKIRSSLAPAKEKYVDVVNTQLRAIQSATFSTRTASEGVVGLTELETAYAIAVSQRKPEKAHWANVTEASVVTEVKAYFDTLTVSEKAKLRQNAYVKLELAKIQLAKADELV
jgi:hypothetical protein